MALAPLFLVFSARFPDFPPKKSNLLIHILGISFNDLKRICLKYLTRRISLLDCPKDGKENLYFDIFSIQSDTCDMLIARKMKEFCIKQEKQNVVCVCRAK